jgi:multiple sugar transport system ATP-binding protein
VLGIRPEHIGIEGGQGFAAKVEMIEPMGAETLVWARLGANAVSIRAPGERQFAIGETVYLSLPPARLSLFDAAGGKRL